MRHGWRKEAQTKAYFHTNDSDTCIHTCIQVQMSRIPEAWLEERGPDKGVFPYKRFRYRKLKEMLETWEADGDIIIHEESVCIDFNEVMPEREVLNRFQNERDVVRAWLRVRVPDHTTQVCIVSVYVCMYVCIY